MVIFAYIILLLFPCCHMFFPVVMSIFAGFERVPEFRIQAGPPVLKPSACSSWAVSNG